MIRSSLDSQKSETDKYIGIDIGSVSVKAVLMSGTKQILEDHYVRSHGQPVETILLVLKDLFSRISADDVKAIAVTGTGGKLLAEILNISFINEIVSQSVATGHFHPEVRTVVEIGGEDSKFMFLEIDTNTKKTKVVDFSMNTMCAAGTGSFLDQQATRLGVSIENEFGDLAMKSANPPRIAGRCSVFAKTDMIHLQQEATPVHDIVAGLCYALVRNFKSNIAKGKKFITPIAFQGGVAANKGIIRAFEDLLNLKSGELVVPEHFRTMGAVGAALTLFEKQIYSPFTGLEALENYLKERKVVKSTRSGLKVNDYKIVDEPVKITSSKKVEAFVGVDIGSISTNVVVLDRDKNVLARRYLMTAGKPIEAVKQGLYEVGEEVADKVDVQGVVTTGSGRYLIADFIGADLAKNEITAHATGAASFDKDVDTIFEIGGQDSKYISLENGAIVDFTMNKVCAAGTGSFLEEQAEKLDINIIKEFGKRALDSKCPAPLGERCTVFMESDLNHHQQLGMPKDDLVAGLSYSIVLNYINRVVENRKIGKKIFFQGGVAANKGVKAAFEMITGKEIIVPPHHDVMGAIGCAIIAMEERTWDKPGFKGFDLRDKKFEMTSFECKDCSNMCEVRKVTITGQSPLYYGSRCGKYDEETKQKGGKGLPRLFNERRNLLLNAYSEDKPARPIGRTVGIPQITTFHELYPLWKAFFIELGLEVVLSGDTNSEIIHKGVESVNAETCLPVKVGHGHALDLIDKDIDYLFIPSIINMTHSCDEITHSYACPYVQCMPYLIKSAIDLDAGKFKFLQPIFHFEYGRKNVNDTLRKLAEDIGQTGDKVETAIKAAWESLDKFTNGTLDRGAEILDNLRDDEIALVVVSRSYNGCDRGMNLNLPEKLRDLGIIAIPMDYLPLDIEDIAKDFPNMYWKYGQKILAAARFVAKDKRLYPIYITNFGCGPDSFITKYFADEMRGKPYLMLEIDEHSSDVGAITRCEAFLDSLKNAKKELNKKKTKIPYDAKKVRKRTIYIPHMLDHGRIFAAAMRANGVNGEAMPMADEESLELARKYTSGKECFPAIITTGDIIKKAQSKDFDPDASAFLMANASGPCRFGQYNTFHRNILDKLGFHNVPIFTLDQGDKYNEDTDGLGSSFRRMAWNGIVFVDYLQKLLRQTRPYEINKGESGKAYGALLRLAETSIEDKRSLVSVSKEAVKVFKRIEVDMSKPRPLIGIIGEVYVRCNDFSNNFLEQRIEKLGGEVSSPPFTEWINYIGLLRREDCKRKSDYKGLFTEYISEGFQRFDEYRIGKPFRSVIRKFAKETPASEVVESGKHYIDDSYKGDPVLSFGRATEYVENDFDGIANVLPFHCMPGTIVNSVLEKFQKDHAGIPCIKLAFDGQEETNEETRLEAFMHQVQQRMESRLGMDLVTH
ncbi:MAG: acyl-CoA dehydratase activase [Candidatus Anammoxibacter sp.]